MFLLRSWIGPFFIFSLSCLVYLPALKNDFIWDDALYISENMLIRSLSFASISKMLVSFHASNWHPLTWLSLAFDYYFWGLDPFGYHLTNILLHGLNALLVFFVTMQLLTRGKTVHATASQSPKEPLNATTSFIAAGATALFFGLHPIHVESVVWIAERKDLLCALFYLLTISSYLTYTASPIDRNRWFWFIVCFVLFILALMSKPMAVTLPLTLLLLDIYPLKRIVLSSFHNGKKSASAPGENPIPYAQYRFYYHYYHGPARWGGNQKSLIDFPLMRACLMPQGPWFSTCKRFFFH